MSEGERNSTILDLERQNASLKEEIQKLKELTDAKATLDPSFALASPSDLFLKKDTSELMNVIVSLSSYVSHYHSCVC